MRIRFSALIPAASLFVALSGAVQAADEETLIFPEAGPPVGKAPAEKRRDSLRQSLKRQQDDQPIVERKLSPQQKAELRQQTRQHLSNSKKSESNKRDLWPIE